MKKSLIPSLPVDSSGGFSPLIAALTAGALISIGTICSQAAVTLTDTGATPPTPGTNDISQLSTTGDTGNPNSKNYYSNNNPPPGEEFTTGANVGGYTMTDIYVNTGNGSGNGIGGSTTWTLYIYSVSGSSATLIEEYSGLTSGTTFNGGDWLHFGGLSIPLATNTTYAYAISSGSSAYTGLEDSTTALSGANALLLPTEGGSVSTVSGFNGVFDIGLALGTIGTVSEQSSAPTPGLNDVSQLSNTGNTSNPNGKNYFSNNNSSGLPIPPGEQFTTPAANPGGYMLTNLFIQTGNGSGNGIGAVTPWTLYIYSVSGNTATLLGSEAGVLGTSFTTGGWIQFANLSVTLEANATYAFALSSGSQAYTGLENSTATLAGGTAVLINSGSGAITTVTGYNGVFDAGLSPIAAPAPPTGVAAVPGNNQVTLTWTAPSGAVTGYDVYRSTTSGSGYTLLAEGTDVAGSPFTDSTAVNNTTYYYVVTALNGGVQSLYSSQVGVTPPRTNEIVTWNGVQTSDNHWTLNTSEGNWLGIGTTYFENQDAAVFNDDSTTGAETVNLDATVLPASLAFDTTNVSYTLSGSGAISGFTGLTNGGSGTVVLAETGGDTFSGGIAVQGGTVILDNANAAVSGGTTIAGGATLQIGNNDANGSLPSGRVTNQGTLEFDRSDNALIEANAISGSGTIIEAGAGGTVQLAGNNSFAGTVLVTNNSTLQAGSATALGTTSGTTVIASGSALDLDFGGVSIANPVYAQGSGIGGNGAIIDSVNGGDPSLSAITLTGDTVLGGAQRWDIGGLSTRGNAYNLTVTGGAYHELNDANIDANLANIILAGSGTTFGDKGTTSLGNPADILEIESETIMQLWNNGSANVTVNKNVLIDNGGTLQNGSGANQITGPVTLGAGVCYLDIGSASLALNGDLSGSGILDMEDYSSGVLAINGNASAFTGGAYVYGGKLLANSELGCGVVCESGAILGGIGTVDGLADVYGALVPGTAGEAGTFNAAGGLTLEFGATLTNGLSSTVNGSNGVVAVTGNLTVNGNTIVLNPLNGTLENGIYPLITYSGTLSGSFAGVQTASPTAYSLTLTNITSTTPNEIAVIVLGAPSRLAWNDGSGDGEWNAGESLNWTNPVAHDLEQFFNADTVIFDDSITNSANATLVTSTNIDIASGQVLAPAAFTNNSTVDYTISGGGQISGGVNIVKSGSGILTISNMNNFSGGIAINAGTVQVNGSGGNTALGSGTPVINTGGTLLGLDGDAFGYAPDTAPTNIYINGGTVSDSGTANYRITLPNVTFAGGTLTSAPGNTGDGDGNYSTFGNGTICTITTLATNTTAVIGAGTLGFGKPTIFSTGAGNVTTGATPGIDLWVTTKLVPYGIQAITKTGAGLMALDNTNNATWNDPITISAGTLQLGTTNDTGPLAAPAGVGNITNDATLLISGSQSVSVSNVISGTGNVIVNSGTAILTASNTYTGNTIVNGGTLALSGTASIAKSPNIVIAGGSTLNVGGLLSVFTLGSDQTLGNSASAATINGSVNAMGTLSLAYSSGAPSLSISNGALTLSAGTVVNINNVGSTLPVGSYVIVAPGSGGSVGGTAPSTVTVNGNGTVAGQPVSLQLKNGALQLVVGSPATSPTITGIRVNGTTLTITAASGPDGGQLVVLESTNLLLPLSQWTPVLTNSFDGSGNLDLSTNIVTPGNPQEFYLLQVP